MKTHEMRRSGLKQGWCMLMVVAVVATAWGAGGEYFTGFEPPEFTIGPLPQELWTVDAGGSASIEGTVVSDGLQALEIGPASTVDRDLAAIGGGDVIWIDAFARVSPQDPLPNPSEVGTGSSLVHFSQSMDIACYDGTSQNWVSTGVPVDPNQWYRITIRQDYRTQTWDCYVNGERVLANLGFKDSLSQLSGFKASSSQSESSFLDNFHVGTEVPAFLYPGSDYQNLFEFSTLWDTTDQTAYNETLFRLYDITQDNSINADDLYRLIYNLQDRTEFN